MATAAQILANRANSQPSGLTSSKVVLPGEDPAEYGKFRAGILDQYQPANATERILSEELAAAGWRLNRARAIETEVLKQLMGDTADAPVGLATVFVEKPKEFERLQRYLTSIERACYRALHILTRLQKERRTAEQVLAVEKAWLARAAEEQAVGQPSGCGGLQSAPANRPNRLASFGRSTNMPPLPREAQPL